jgi:hypothetical protein
MARFKHTGQRAQQLRDGAIKRNTERAMTEVEKDLGRSLTPGEMENIAKQVKDTFGNLPVYGGE